MAACSTAFQQRTFCNDSLPPTAHDVGQFFFGQAFLSAPWPPPNCRPDTQSASVATLPFWRRAYSGCPSQCGRAARRTSGLRLPRRSCRACGNLQDPLSPASTRPPRLDSGKESASTNFTAGPRHQCRPHQLRVYRRTCHAEFNPSGRLPCGSRSRAVSSIAPCR